MVQQALSLLQGAHYLQKGSKGFQLGNGVRYRSITEEAEVWDPMTN